MPEVVQRMMLAAPNTYFVRLAQGLLYRNAPLDVVWGDLAMTLVLGALFFLLALKRFRASLR
jgi:ABC-2 type transport system permease protein